MQIRNVKLFIRFSKVLRHIPILNNFDLDTSVSQDSVYFLIFNFIYNYFLKVFKIVLFKIIFMKNLIF